MRLAGPRSALASILRQVRRPPTPCVLRARRRARRRNGSAIHRECRCTGAAIVNGFKPLAVVQRRVAPPCSRHPRHRLSNGSPSPPQRQIHDRVEFSRIYANSRCHRYDLARNRARPGSHYISRAIATKLFQIMPYLAGEDAT